MSEWVNFAAIVAVFVLLLILGLKFITVFNRKQGPVGPQTFGDPAQTLRNAEAEAESVRQRAQRDVEAARRAADTEIESLRRAAHAEAEAARTSGDAARARAEAVAADLITDARRTVERDSADRAAQLERLELELTSRAERLDQRVSELTQRAESLDQRHASLEAAAAELAGAQQELAAAQDRLTVERTEFLERAS